MLTVPPSWSLTTTLPPFNEKSPAITLLVSTLTAHPRLAASNDDGLYRSERTHYKIGLTDVEGGIADGGEQSAKKNVKVGYQNIPSLAIKTRALSSTMPKPNFPSLPPPTRCPPRHLLSLAGLTDIGDLPVLQLALQSRAEDEVKKVGIDDDDSPGLGGRRARVLGARSRSARDVEELSSVGKKRRDWTTIGHSPVDGYRKPFRVQALGLGRRCCSVQLLSSCFLRHVHHFSRTQVGSRYTVLDDISIIPVYPE
ncbi:uncharacterized protein ARMOST_18041 [Armillaria ostoyae]|uniref:Uncharacterized protein n=1 Tax=Armillaria ostoyae TaxID=47428 RepID=A0A284S0N5_ARMOS|nr:uncharacterized protein ARMOST_18041 [Armillaria ostoyae]